MGYVSKEWLKEHGFMLFQYKKDADGSEGVLPVNIDDLEEDGLSDTEIYSSLLLEMARVYLTVLDVGGNFINKESSDVYVNGVKELLKAAHVPEAAIDRVVRDCMWKN